MTLASAPAAAPAVPAPDAGVFAVAAGWISSHRVILALLLLAAVMGLLWTAATPPWRIPDEPQHFGYIQALSREHALPAGDSTYIYPDVTASLVTTNFAGITGQGSTSADLDARELNAAANHPPLYYLLMLPAYRLARGGSVETQLYSVRIWGLGIFLLLILASWRLAREAFPGAPYLHIAVPLTMIFHPQLGFILAGVNNDGLLALLFTVWLWQLVLMIRGDLGAKRALLLGAVTGLGMLTKSTFIVAYPLFLAVAGVMMAWRRSDYARILRAVGIVLGVSLVICGWYYLKLSLLGMPETTDKVERYGHDGLVALLFSSGFTRDLLASFLGNFSWLSIPLKQSVTDWFERLIWIAGLGVGVSLVLDRVWRRRQSIKPWLAALLAAACGGLFLFAAYFELNIGAAQGRYLFAAIFPFWALFQVGLTGWLPPVWRPRCAALVVAAVAVMGTWSLLSEFLPRVT